MIRFLTYLSKAEYTHNNDWDDSVPIFPLKQGRQTIILYLGLCCGLRCVKSQTPKTFGSDNFMVSLFNLYDQVSCVWGKLTTPESIKKPIKKRAD